MDNPAMDSKPATSGASESVFSLSQMDLELYFLIGKFLSTGPCSRTYQALREELEQHKLLPKRIDWTGGEHFRSYENLLDINCHLAPNHLLKICQRIIPLLNREVRPSVEGVVTLLGAGRQSMLRTEQDAKFIRWSGVTHTALSHRRPLMPPFHLAHQPNLVNVTTARHLSSYARREHIVPPCLYSKIIPLSRSLGHLSAVYCIAFDRTGEYIFTGADDHLVKVWSALTGRLLCTMRGHAAEITDIACSYGNSLLAVGSCDKLIRIWCLRTATPLAVLHGHSHMITSVRFCPYIRGVTQYLISTGGDGCLCFWEFNATKHTFNPKPIKFVERSRAGTQMLCSSFSPGGVFLATGSSDSVVRVYCFSGAAPEKICELEAHADRVDSIQYANRESRFVSGSKDGIARIWRFERQEWKAILLNVSLRLPGSTASDDDQRVTKYRVTMVCWSLDDEFVITAVNDFTLKIWNSHTGALLQILHGHEDEVFVLEHNPVDRRVILSAGHDGQIMIWDIISGYRIKTFHNSITGQGHGSVFDCKWAPDGQSFAATDSHGYLRYFGFGSTDRYKHLPEEVFFHTDYRPLIRDANNYVLDEQTQQAPHLMAPPFLVDIDGNPHPARYQRLVPGREGCQDTQLVPLVVVNASGDREVLDFPNGAEDDLNSPPPPSAPPVGGDDRPILDEMIARLQQEHDERVTSGGSSRSHQRALAAEHRRLEGDSAGTPSSRRSRRSRDLDVVRSMSTSEEQSMLSQQRAAPLNQSVWTRRVLVHEMDPYVAEAADRNRQALAEEEIKKFVHERKKKPLLPSEIDSSDSGSYMRTRRHEKRGRRGQRAAQNEETGRNRLLARALYDTETEGSSAVENGGGAENEPAALDTSTASVNNVTNNREPASPPPSSDGESTEYSDWVPDGVNLQPPTRRSQRQVKRRQWTVETEDSGSETEIDERRRSRDGDDAEVDATATAGQERRTRSQKKKMLIKTRKKSNVIKQKKHRALDTDIAPEFRPPEWLTDVVIRKTPYFPQMGDEVIYFLQGHQQYVEAVRSREIYDIDVTRGQPWHVMPNIREQELMKVVGIKYEIRRPRGPRLVCLKLALIDSDSGRLVGPCFSIKYHDMSGVVDFVVLRQTYNIAMSRNWSVGDRFRCLIDDAWWIGVVRSMEPFQQEYPDSMFQCLGVQWDNGEHEKLSPWDLEPLDNQRLPTMKGASVPVLAHELEALRYDPKPSEWPAVGREAECDRIIAGLEQIMSLSIAENFSVPVDLNTFPIYAVIIAYPVDLSLIKARLENRFYRRVAAIQYDVRYIERNARVFNDSRSAIVEYARIITELCVKFISDESCGDPMPIYAQLTKGKKLFVNGPPGTSLAAADHDDSSADGADTPTTEGLKKSQKSRSSSNAERPGAWKQEAEVVLQRLLDSHDSAPFRSPVNPVNFPDYRTVIESPVDLGTIQRKLSADEYANVSQFCRDVRLVFSNSRTYNTNKRSQIYTMTLRLASLFDARIKPVEAKYDSSPPKTHASKQPAVKSSHSTRQSSRASSPVLSRRLNGDAGPSTSSHNINSSVATTDQRKPTSSRQAGTSRPSPRSLRSRPQRNAKRRRPLYGGSETEDSEAEAHGTKRPRPGRSAQRHGTDDDDETAVVTQAHAALPQAARRRIRTRLPFRRANKAGRWLTDSEDEDVGRRPAAAAVGGEETEEEDGGRQAGDDSDEEFTLGRRAQNPAARRKRTAAKRSPTLSKRSRSEHLTNGHSKASTSAAAAAVSNSSERYSTRCATGVIKRKRYDKVLFSDDENDDNDDDQNTNDADYGIRSARRRRDWDSESGTDRRRGTPKSTPRKNKSRGKVKVLKPSQNKKDSDSSDDDSDAKSSDSDRTEAGPAEVTKSVALGSDTEDYSSSSENTAQDSELEGIPSSRLTRSAMARGDVAREDHSYDVKYETRNKGRRTVRYDEESDHVGDSDGDRGARPGPSSRSRSFRPQQSSIRTYMRN